MKVLEDIITALDDFAWGPWMLVLLVGTGIFLTARNGFIQFGKLGYSLKNTIGKMFHKHEAGTGEVTVEVPLSFGSCPTSTVPVSVCAGGSLDLAAVAGGANVLFAGLGGVRLRNAATATGSFTLSNAVSVALLEGFRWPKTMALAFKDGPDGPPRLLLDADVRCDTMTINGRLQSGRRTYGSSQSSAIVKDDAHFGGAGTVYVRHPVRFSFAIW